MFFLTALLHSLLSHGNTFYFWSIIPFTNIGYHTCSAVLPDSQEVFSSPAVKGCALSFYLYSSGCVSCWTVGHRAHFFAFLRFQTLYHVLQFSPHFVFSAGSAGVVSPRP